MKTPTTPPDVVQATPHPMQIDLSADELQLRAQGHVSELPRQFGAFATLSLAFSITNSWVGFSAVFATPLLAGGGPTVFFGLIVATIACSFITAGLAELASAFPSSGGQYHFAFMVSSPKYRAATAFTVGWLSVIAWWFITATAGIFCAQLVGNIASFLRPDYVWTQWQIYLIYLLLCTTAVAVVVWLPRQMPMLQMVFFMASLVGFVVFFITVLATSKDHKQRASTVFTKWDNQTGWSDGTAFLLGVGTCMYAYLAVDSVTHLAEEMPNPGTGVPRAMCLTILIGMLTVFMWTLAFLFSTSDLDEVSMSHLPILTVYYQALRSKAGAAFFAVWLLFIYYGATIGCFLSAGRQTWSFARDNGLPYSKVFAKTHPTLQVPVNATVATLVFCVFYGLIYIGSTTAYNSFVNLSILGLNITYAIPQAVVVIRGRDKVLPKRQFDLGPVLGPICNIFSTIWMLVFTVLFCFPVFLPVTLQNMNYLSVVVAAVCLFILILWWGGKRKTFEGPHVELAASVCL
ncbi:amino acid/polyamine transporter I [Exophiala viscosa]|uniref:amino acid/polyamine transporter I n=1 Tax=Exophiala viscosa TaxID=2486360 RepID=UPI00218DF7D4|nr:amino acid/polyamine transporter I [Exophiala viscosa]